MQKLAGPSFSADSTSTWRPIRAPVDNRHRTGPPAGQLLSLHEGAIVSYSIVEDASAATTARSAAETLVTRAVPGSPA